MLFFKLEPSPILGRNKSILCLSASNSLAGAGCSQRYYKFMLRVLRLRFNSLNVCKENFVAIFSSFLFFSCKHQSFWLQGLRLCSRVLMLTNIMEIIFWLLPLKSESHTKIPTSTLSFLAKGVGWCPYIALFSSSIAHISWLWYLWRGKVFMWRLCPPQLIIHQRHRHSGQIFLSSPAV